MQTLLAIANQKCESIADLNGLYTIIEHCPDILKQVEETPFVQTPLHAAAAAGNTIFAAEMMSLMPSFARKMDGNGLTPLHVALGNGQTDTARDMIQLDPGLVRVPGKGKWTPMHYLVADERHGGVDGDKFLHLLVDFLKACPDAVVDVTVDRKTPLHLAVEGNHLRAFQVLYAWICRTEQVDVLTMVDHKGKNVLHYAVQNLQVEVVKQLAPYTPLRIQKDHKKRGCTPASYLKYDANDERTTKISKLLDYGDPTDEARKNIKIDRLKFFLTTETLAQKVICFLIQVHRGMSLEMRNVVLVVAVLVATAAYQAALQPPGGLTQASAGTDLTGKINAVFPLIRSESPKNNSIVPTTDPGKVVMGNDMFAWFMTLNTVAFIAAVGVIMFALPVWDYTTFLHTALICMTGSYLIAIYQISNDHNVTNGLAIFSSCVFFVACLARFYLFTIRLRWPHPRIHNFIYWIGLPKCFPWIFRAIYRVRLHTETVNCSPNHGHKYIIMHD